MVYFSLKNNRNASSLLYSFFKIHGLLQIFNRPQWFVISGGSKSYIKKIVEGYKDKVKLSTPVKKVRRDDNGVDVFFGEKGSFEKFDKVIFATHSDQATEIIRRAKPKKKLIF